MSEHNGQRRGFGIPRVSKKNGRDGEAFRSVPAQWLEVDAVAKANNINMIDPATGERRGGADVDVSGTTMQRKWLQRGIDAIRDNEADVLVFPKLDRYARTTIGGLQTLKEVTDLGGSLYFGDIDVDTSTPRGEQLFTILLSNAQAEVAEKRLQLARDAKQATEDGIAIRPLLPGYRRYPKDHPEKPRRVDVDPDVAPLIRPLFERRAAGESWAALRRWWHDETGEWLKLSRFRRMIESRLYLGELWYGKQLSPVRHEALVTSQLWEDAQTDVLRPSRSRIAPSLLAGVLVCSGCGHPMTSGQGGRGRSPVYRCQSKAGSWACDAPVTVTAKLVDPYVEEKVLEWARKRETPDVLTTGDLSEEFAAIDAEIADVREERRAFVRVIDARDPDFAEGMRIRDAKLEGLAAKRRALQDERVVAGVAYRIEQAWESGELDVEDKRQLIREAVASIVIHPVSTTDAGGRARSPMSERAQITFRD